MKQLTSIMRVFSFVVLLMLLGSSRVGAQEVVTVTMYYAAKGKMTADGTIIKNAEKQRICAVSPDLLKKYPYGTRLYVEGFGYYIVHDRTARRMRGVVDLLIPRTKKAYTKHKVKIRKK